MDGLTGLPPRSGDRPRTQRVLPHTQLDQQPTDPAIREELARRAFALRGVVERPSGISVPGARALVLEGTAPSPESDAFLIGTEFAHLHPSPDLSLHATLPTADAQVAIDAGWAEWHPLVDAGELPRTIVMLYAPRTAEELEVVWALLQVSHRFAVSCPCCP